MTVGRKTEKLVVAVFQRMSINVTSVKRLSAVVILSDLGCCVAMVFQHLCESGRAVGKAAVETAFWIPANLMPARVPPGARRAAYRGGGVGTGE